MPTPTSNEPTPSAVSRRVALVADAGSYVGVPLARLLAQKGHDLVLGNVAEGLAAELEGLGATVEVVPDVHNLNKPESSARLVQAALDRFGRIDAATMFSGRIVTGSFLRSTSDDLAAAVRGCIEAPYHFLRAVVPVMVEQRDGQVLVLTSAAGAKPTPNAPLYSAARAGATMLVKNVAAEVASRNVQVNALGTNFMDFPAFRAASGADDPAVLERIVAGVPQRRLGTVEECAAFCTAFLDGTSRFTTGQFVAYAGGWA